MAFIVNDVTIQTEHGLAFVTLHETDGSKNSVVHVIVPVTFSPRQTVRARRKAATSAAKAAVEGALRVL